MRAVVVDDDPGSAKAIARLLRAAGCDATASADALSAVDLALQPGVDLVCIDMAMPGLDGFDVLSLIRSHEHTLRAPGVPVIAVTGQIAAADRSAAIAAGFLAHLAKPVRLEALHDALARVAILREETLRSRDTVDREVIEARLQPLLADDGERLGRVAGMALGFEVRSRDALERCLLDAYEGRRRHAAERATAHADTSAAFGGQHLATLYRRFAASIDASPDAFETAAVRARAELDRVLFTLRGHVLGA